MRIQVFFGDTPVLVPCGDGKLTVRELIQKAITRFKKVVDKHPDDVIEVRSLRLADSGSFVDQDDEVADVLEDKEAVILEYYIPGYNPRSIDITDDSAITGPTEPFSTGSLDNTDHTPYIPGIEPLEDHTHHPLASIREDFVSDEPEPDVNELHHHVGSPHNSQELHMVLPDASQDTELVAQQNWHSQHSHTSGSQSQEPSPRMERKTGWRTSNECDSGYAPTKSQESYGHSSSQPKSQEVYTPGSTDLSFQHNSSSQGHTDFPLQSRDFPGPPSLTSTTLETSTAGSQTNLARRSNLRNTKDDEHKSGPFDHPGMHKVSTFNRDQDPVRRSLRSNEPQDNFSLTPTRTFGTTPRAIDPQQGGVAHGRGLDIPYGRGSYAGGYPDRTSTALPHSLDDSYDNRARIAHQDWRRSFHSGDYNHYHDVAPYASLPGGGGRYMDFHNEPFQMRTGSGRFTRPPESLNGRFLPNRRGNYRLPRTISHEHMEQGVPPYVGGRGHSYEEYNGPVDYYLSQPTGSYFSYDSRPGPPPGHVQMMSYDPRIAMNGPLGHSLSQPGVMISRGGRGMHDFDRRGPHPLVGARRGVLKSDSLERGRDHPCSIDEEFDHLEEDDTEDGKRGRNPFRRDFRKSMFRDGLVYSQWMDRMNDIEFEESEEVNEVPEYDGENTQSQRSRSPSPVSGSHKKHGSEGTDGRGDEGEESEEDDEFGNIHIVELHKGEEHLGIQLTHFTSDGIDLGVFIGGMDDNGFAAKSGKLQYQDRILACNGVDFTKDLSNHRVEELFLEMAHEPLLRMAISRGINVEELQNDERNGETPANGEGQVGVVTPMSMASPARSEATSRSTNVAGSSLAQPPSLAVTNTRQMGVKHTIELTKGQRGLGFGLTSRDVLTDDKNQPIYVKSIHSGGSAFLDGRLKIGDRLLQVNDVEVTGMTRPQVVQLLRGAEGVVTIVVSRQEDVDETAEEYTSQSSTQGPAPLITADKTVLTLDISLNNAGAAGLGVTVYGKATTSRKSGDLGIYINSIMLKGAAALDGRLRKNDQILCINKQNILGRSNQEALDILRKALASATGNNATVQLVVARKASMSPAMAALGERPEEEEREMDQERLSHEVGIDCPKDVHQSSAMVVPAAHSQTSLNSTGSFEGVSNRLASQTSLTPSDLEPSRGSMRGRAHTFSESPSHRGSSPRPRGDHHRSASPLLQRRRILRADERDMGSGEFYDRLEPLNATSPHSPLVPHPFPPVTSSHLSHLPTSSRHSYSETLSSLYDNAAESVRSSSGYPSDQHYATQSLDRKGGGYNPRHAPTYDRPHSYHPVGQEMTSLQTPPTSRHHPPQMSRDYNASSLRRPLSPDTPPYSMVQSSGQSSRDSSLRHQSGVGRDMSPYDLHDRYGQPFSPYSSDSASSTPYGGPGVWDVSQVPTRGSGRKDRNKPERGSGRHHASYHSASSGSASAVSNVSSELNVINGYATIPRSGSRSSERGSATGRSTTPTNPETSSLCSLENLRLSDSESNTAFRRDDAGRISITKKTKKNPREDLAHLHFDNAEPLVEGEAPVLIRTGSDGCLNQQQYSSTQAQLLQVTRGLEVGPQLGLVKSSSLESLHNVMAHSINRSDLVDDGSDLRNRSTRNSFRRAVDHSYDNGTEKPVDEVEQHRGVDVPFDLESSTASTPAVISFTKNPAGSKTKKKGFLKKVFKKRKGGKKSSKSPQTSRRTQSVTIETLSSESLTASLTPEEQEQVLRMQRFTLSLKGAGPSQEDGVGGQSQTLPAGDNRYSNPPALAHRHSMPLLEDYDSPDSPDEVLLSSMAKV